MFQENCEFVERFDEVMTQKASKISLEEQILKVHKLYEPQFKNVDKMMLEAEIQRQNYLASFNSFSEII